MEKKRIKTGIASFSLSNQKIKNTERMQLISEVMNMGKMIIVTFEENEEKNFKRTVSLLADECNVKIIQHNLSPVLSFKGLEIWQP